MIRRVFIASATVIWVPGLSFASPPPPPPVSEPAPMVFFARDSSELSRDTWYTLNRIENGRPVRMTIMGHADRSEHDRMALSLRRASGVRQGLLQLGCSPDIMTVIGYGDERPLIRTPEDVGEAQNRRVEIVTFQ